MKVILFGATDGGAGCPARVPARTTASRACSRSAAAPLAGAPEAARRLILKDLSTSARPGADLQGYDACFFCLGVSVAGITRLTTPPDL